MDGGSRKDGGEIESDATLWFDLGRSGREGHEQGGIDLLKANFRLFHSQRDLLTQYLRYYTPRRRESS
jgi:hypothetical protein